MPFLHFSFFFIKNKQQVYILFGNRKEILNFSVILDLPF